MTLMSRYVNITFSCWLGLSREKLLKLSQQKIQLNIKQENIHDNKTHAKYLYLWQI